MRAERRLRARSASLTGDRADKTRERTVIGIVRRLLDEMLHPARLAAAVETGLAIVAILVGVSVTLRLAIALLHRIVRADDPRRPPERAASIRTLVPPLESVLRYGLYFVATVMILDRLKFNVAALLASAGVAGIAIGFGAQHVIRDTIAGFFLLFEGVMQIGDSVRIGDVIGEVERINLRSTQIRQFTGELVTIPNGDIGRLANMNRGFMRAVVVVSLPYGVPLAPAMEVMRRTAETWATEHKNDVLGPPEVQGIVEFGAADVRTQLVVTVRPGFQQNAERELRRLLVEAFKRENIPLAGSPPASVTSGAASPATATIPQPGTPAGPSADTPPPKGPGPAR